MKPSRILVPLDAADCSPEIFARVNAFADRPDVAVILLHVLNLKVAVRNNHIYEELVETARQQLQGLAQKHLHPDSSALLHVRVGDPVEEIVAEAGAEEVDLIILSVADGPACRLGPPSLWKRLARVLVPGIPERLYRAATCPVLVVHPDADFNYQEPWGARASDLCSAFQSLDTASGTRKFSRMMPEAPSDEKGPSRRLAA